MCISYDQPVQAVSGPGKFSPQIQKKIFVGMVITSLIRSRDFAHNSQANHWGWGVGWGVDNQDMLGAYTMEYHEPLGIDTWTEYKYI